MQVELNSDQKEALKKGKRWYRKLPKQIFEIAGYAGTGKTTIVNMIIEACHVDIHVVLFVTLVGKAAMVLARNGLPAKTIHSTFYNCVDVPKTDEDGNIQYQDGKIIYCKRFMKKTSLPKNIKLIIIDEASMVNAKLKADILSFNIPIIALGDLHQLPPVFGDPVFLQHPDAVLETIMRQKADNPIIEIATRARLGQRIGYGNYGNKVLVAKRDDVMRSKDILKNSNVILCGRNSTRDALNNYIRHDIMGIDTNEITIGDKLICRKNNWEETIGDGIYLINGMVGYVEDIDVESYNGSDICIDFRPEFLENDDEGKNTFHNIRMDYRYMKLPYGLRANHISYVNRFEFGYAITTHLSQGSQYSNVLVLNERMGDFDFYTRWLYTAVTRAVDKLVIAL